MFVQISCRIDAAVMASGATIFTVAVAVPDRGGEPLSETLTDRLKVVCAVACSASSLATRRMPLLGAREKRPALFPLRAAKPSPASFYTTAPAHMHPPDSDSHLP